MADWVPGSGFSASHGFVYGVRVLAVIWLAPVDLVAVFLGLGSRGVWVYGA